jgi:hypothetical protein
VTEPAELDAVSV